MMEEILEEPVRKCTVQDNIVDDGAIPCCSKSLLVQNISASSEPAPTKSEALPIKESLAKPKNTKRWFEDEKPVVSIVGPNELMIDGKLMVVDYANFTKEADVQIDYESDEIELPDLPGFIRPCKKEFCRLGCICKSIEENEIVRSSRCQIVKCMFGCICFQSIFMDYDKHADNTEKDVCSYKQLERGIISLRAKRTTRLPPRLRNEYVMDLRLNKNNLDNVYPFIPARKSKKKLKDQIF